MNSSLDRRTITYIGSGRLLREIKRKLWKMLSCVCAFNFTTFISCLMLLIRCGLLVNHFLDIVILKFFLSFYISCKFSCYHRIWSFFQSRVFFFFIVVVVVLFLFFCFCFFLFCFCLFVCLFVFWFFHRAMAVWIGHIKLNNLSRVDLLTFLACLSSCSGQCYSCVS